MLSINMSDVINVLNSCKNYLIGFGVVLILAIVAIVVAGKLSKDKKYLVRGNSLLAILLALGVTANLICFGPMSTMLSLVTGNGTITEETSAAANELCTEIAKEGIVLLENDGGVLPMASGDKLNVFGWASTNPCYGGTGSGALNDAYHTVSLLEGLANAGIETNDELTKFYTDYKADRPSVGMWSQDWTLPEPNVSLYTDELLASAKEFSDTAMVVITRVGGEGADLPIDMPAVVDGTYAHTTTPMSYDDTLNEGNDWDAGDTFLNLTNREEELIDMVCQNFDNVILVYNGANAFELGFVEEYSQIKGAIWCAGTGQSGFDALGQIIAGAVNPSGKTIDTFVYDLTATPVFNNIGLFTYTNMLDQGVEDMFTKSLTSPSFVNYVEGIYVGYKFYETAYAEAQAADSGSAFDFDYDAVVQYPFGYGLSYTSFTQEMGELKTAADGTITFDVTVTNTGSVAGKDVVEVYYNPPYTNGGIEKAAANLVAFDKTDLLEPGASQTVTISINEEDMASYDTYGAGCYVLEQGDYILSINSDAHTVIDSQVYNVASTVTYKDGRSTDQAAPTNQFGFAEGDVTYLSRKDAFANYAQATAAPANYEMTGEAYETFRNNSSYLTAEETAADEDPDAEPITTGANNGLQLVDLRGAEYDDPQWESLMDQLTLDEMNAIISLGGYQTNSIDSIGKVRTNDCDGPASINNNFTGTGSIGFPAGVMIAATWNTDLAYAFGDSIGKMADEMDVSGWYAPAMNIHRSAFAGRNFEYYSEDGLLSGKIAANAIAAAQSNGVYAYMKHFALNDQETNRTGMLCTWSNEQAIREIYLKPFEISVKEANCGAVMSSFNYIGNRWAGGCNELCNVVLRDEWGFQGFVLTDYFGVYGYMSADQAIRNGTDACLVNYPTATNNVQFRDTNGAQQAMRQAAKNILYTVVNSRAYADENLNPGMPKWQIAAIAIDVLLVVLLVLLEIKVVFKGYKKRKNA